ncbi:MAG: hypothetical protein NTV74_01795 [Euryarchaeota archaeon]|nr:hypothetical protein [Euryarchaeota archaeon]
MMEESAPIAERKEKIKERILDETFKKAEVSRGLRSPDSGTHKKRSYEKTFPKVGLLIIALAIVGLLFISNVPWVYIRYDAGKEATFDGSFENVGNQTLLNIFKSPYHLGLSTDDITYAYSMIFIGFISLVILGTVITIFGILDKFRDFSIETFISIHFIFTTAIIAPSTFIALAGMKILGAHFLFYHNSNLILDPKLTFLFFPAVAIAVVLGLIIIKLMFTVIRMDFSALQKIKDVETSEPSFPHYALGGKVQ